MKFTKIITLLLALAMIFSLASCNKNQHGQNNHNSHQNQQGGEGNVTYVYSVVSKVLHTADCYHIQRMNEDYKVNFEGDINELLANGYTLCRDCLAPEEEKEEEPEEEDNTNKIPKEEATYVINANSKTFHELDCHHVSVISEKNIEYTNLSVEELMALEHKPCSICLTEASKEYEKTHPKEDKN